ncbi:hypothetical protein F8566_32995 [Actinomadura rudentiformis]|uniref:Uncharacterized protein n=1 Tax=Actinomadura rudentiformis TaxID=359158 RepID=A0A6H9YSU3_9ACTN|nr:hypothetical protein F8566_32995 [Actinomadura rudentiformis]
MARGVPGGYQIRDAKARRWWGDLYELFPDDPLTELTATRAMRSGPAAVRAVDNRTITRWLRLATESPSRFRSAHVRARSDGPARRPAVVAQAPDHRCRGRGRRVGARSGRRRGAQRAAR